MIILEDGYNTGYIYSIIISLFCVSSDGMNKLLNTDTEISDTYYIQEYIKSKFVYQIQNDMSIESSVVNKLRIYLINCGWLRDCDDILINSELNKFYSFLISKMMGYKLIITVIEPFTNITREIQNDVIHITNDYLMNTDGNIIDIGVLVNRWIGYNIDTERYGYKFDILPHTIPIYLDIRDPVLKTNKKYINIMRGIEFMDNGDKIQRTIIWKIQSIICKNSFDEYYTIIFDDTKKVKAYSDKRIPSEWEIDLSDVDTVKKIMREVNLVFYKI